MDQIGTQRIAQQALHNLLAFAAYHQCGQFAQRTRTPLGQYAVRLIDDPTGEFSGQGTPRPSTHTG